MSEAAEEEEEEDDESDMKFVQAAMIVCFCAKMLHCVLAAESKTCADPQQKAGRYCRFEKIWHMNPASSQAVTDRRHRTKLRYSVACARSVDALPSLEVIRL